MTKEDLAARLFAVAQARAAAAGRQFGEGADGDLRQLTAHAAEELLKIGDPAKRKTSIAKAEADIGRLIGMAVSNAEALPGYPPNLLGEQSYFPAKFRFCPCPPIC